MSANGAERRAKMHTEANITGKVVVITGASSGLW
jgi:hypothetical protein